MYYNELDSFIEKIDKLEIFFLMLAARENSIAEFGFRRVFKWESYLEATTILSSFEADFYDLVSFARPVDKQLYEMICSVSEKSNLIHSIGILQTMLRIALERDKHGVEMLINPFTMILYRFGFSRKIGLFGKENISIHQILGALNSLRTLTKKLQELYLKKWQPDEDVFCPSNLDTEKIVVYIENAILEIEQNVPIPPDQKSQLVQYLYKAKSELAEEKPSWNNIIGALVIVATLLSGIASAPQAFENVNSAIQYILGISVKRHIPNVLPNFNNPRS